MLVAVIIRLLRMGWPKMVSRRQALALGGCAACLPWVARPSASEADLDDAFFYCDTPQITVLGVGEENFSAAGQIDDTGFGMSSALLGSDDYGTATRALRWTASNTGLSRNNRPLVLIGFVDGSASEHDSVKTIAQAWKVPSIGLDFDYSNDLKETHIQISFTGGVNKSKTGIEALQFRGQATMWLPDVRKRPGTTASRRAILHEFGHGLMAFGHEHRHPDAGYRFRPAAEIAQIINSSLPIGASPWTSSMVETNITNAPYAASRACTDYDVKSIMHYPVATNWLITGTPVPDPSTTISPLDVKCAIETYSN
ncbi:hypothetical protein [Devosia sp. FKR38]|uniref:hypothetical protein n=1 Tax=Devosia sp. FKR38 TaxID=2562312 RepID=UPI0010BFB15D|nr:hypothetical protein [Devosia sp. FKR38]